MKIKTIGIDRDTMSENVFTNLLAGNSFLQFTPYKHPYNSPPFDVLNEGMGIVWVTGPSFELEDFVRTYKLGIIYRSPERMIPTMNSSTLFYDYDKFSLIKDGEKLSFEDEEESVGC